MTNKKTRETGGNRHQDEIIQSPETQAIAKATAELCGDESIRNSIDVSATMITRMRQMLKSGGTIVADTGVMLEQIDTQLLEGTQAVVKCYLENPEVVRLAERKMTSKAEVATDTALSLNGPKLMVIGSAPAALNRILRRRQTEPLTDVYVVTGVSGFASVISLKEKLRDSHMTYAVLRGRSGGVNVTAAMVNSMLKYIKDIDINA